MDRSHTELSVLKHHYQVHNRTEGKSPCTVEWYDEVLGFLLRWPNEAGRPTNLGAIDEMVIREFLLYLKGRPGTKGPTMASSTMYNRVNALKSFFSWLHRQEYTKENLLSKLKLPKVTQQIIEPLTPDEVAAIFRMMPTNTPWGARDGAIVSLMLDSGVRLSELANLKEADVHLEDQWVKVLGKGSKERMVAFGVACQKTLLHYFFDFRAEPAHQGVDTFFLALDGYPMSPDSVRSVVKRLAKASGIRRLHPHLLRHTYATLFLLNGGDVFLLKQNLGHATLTMVENYLHIASQTAAVRSQGFSPLDRMGLKGARRYRHGLIPGGTQGTSGGGSQPKRRPLPKQPTAGHPR